MQETSASEVKALSPVSQGMSKLQAQTVTDCNVGGHTHANFSLASSGTGAVNLLTGLLPMAIIQVLSRLVWPVLKFTLP